MRHAPCAMRHARGMKLFISFLSGTLLFYLFQYFPFSSIAIFIAVSAYLFFKRNALLIPVIAIGILYAFIRFSPVNDSGEFYNRELLVTGRFIHEVSAVQSDSNIQTFIVNSAFDPGSGEEIEELHNQEIKIFSDFKADRETGYKLFLKTGKNMTRLNPGGIKKSRLYARIIAAGEMQGASGLISDYFSPRSIFNKYRSNLNEHLLGRFNKDSAGLVSAITTGERGYLSEDVRGAFNAAGLAHMLSISGTHFGLFSIMLFGIFIFLIRRLPYRILQRLTLYLTPSQAAAILCIPFMLMYLGISGGSLPAIRSFIMISLFLAGLLMGRKGFWLNSLLLAAFILVIWDPDVILSLSFQLSFTAVLFIGYSLETKEEAGSKSKHYEVGTEDETVGSKQYAVGTVLSKEQNEEEAKRIVQSIRSIGEKENDNKIIRYIRKTFMLTIAAIAGTSPLVAYHFHYFSFIAPLSNLLIAPLIGFVLIPISLISAFSYLITGYYILGPIIGVTADLSVALVKLISEIPFAEMKVPAFPVYLCLFFYAGFLFYIISGRKKKILIIPFMLLLIYALLNVFERQELRVTFLDAGQGDSAVIELPDNKKTIVIDTGRTGRDTADFLKYAGKKDIDALILSHIHPDHSGGLGYIMERFNVKEIWDNGRIEYPEGINARHRALERGDIIELGSFRITVLHPYREFYTLFGNKNDGENNSSLVMKLSAGKNSFLFTGDIQEEAEEDILHLKKWLSSDIIKISHHGSRRSSGEVFLTEVSPSVAVISSGRDNQFGHPSPEMLERLTGVRVFRTDLDGAIKITDNSGSLLIKTYRDFAFEKAYSLDKELSNIRRLFVTW